MFACLRHDVQFRHVYKVETDLVILGQRFQLRDIGPPALRAEVNPIDRMPGTESFRYGVVAENNVFHCALGSGAIRCKATRPSVGRALSSAGGWYSPARTSR